MGSGGLLKSQPANAGPGTRSGFSLPVTRHRELCKPSPCFLFCAGLNTGAWREGKRWLALPWEVGVFLPVFWIWCWGWEAELEACWAGALASSTSLVSILFSVEKVFVQQFGRHKNTDNEMNFCVHNTQLKKCNFRTGEMALPLRVCVFCF